MARLYNLAHLMLSDPTLAEDAVQEALILTWRDLRSLRDPDRFDSWLHRVLIRSVYRVSRTERRRIDRQPLTETLEHHGFDPASAVEHRDEIDRGFRRLEANYRAVLVVHHFLGLPDDAAAQVLGVPVGTFKSRLNRATAALRAELDAEMRTGDRPATSVVR